MADFKDIALAHVRLDTENPRLADDKQNQPATLKAILADQSDKVMVLARDIARNGLNPLDRFMVMQAPDDANDYIALEGNRRLTALKLLANPKLGTDLLAKAQVSKLEKLSVEAGIDNTMLLSCAVVADRGEARHWLRLRHGGQMKGAGVVEWGATEGQRFEARTDKASPELQVLSLLVEKEHITREQLDSISITALRRLFADDAVRQKLGIEINRKQAEVKKLYPEKEVLKGLTAVAEKLADEDFKVRDIYAADDRKAFVSSIKSSQLPNPKAKLAKAEPLGTGSVGVLGGIAAGGGPTGKGGGKKATTRRYVAPTKPALKIDNPRIKDIYIELQSLRLEEQTNAGGVMMRVFLELSVDQFIKKHKLGKRDSLRKKVIAVKDHFKATGVMTDSELAPVQKAISDGSFFATSIDTFNAYVHNEHFSPTPKEVRLAWDHLQGFFVNIWK